MPECSEAFLDLSELLTGFDRAQLLGTGVAGDYLRTLEEVLPGGVLANLLEASGRLPAGDQRDAAVTSEILDDPELGPVARNLILLWYCGTWTALPEDWRQVHGTSPLDTDRVVSPETYVAGLQWVAAGAHPVGARQQGFGAWALAPDGAEQPGAEGRGAEG
jgi:hypothetical protein